MASSASFGILVSTSVESPSEMYSMTTTLSTKLAEKENLLYLSSMVKYPLALANCGSSPNS